MNCVWVSGKCPAAVTPDGAVVLEAGREDQVRRIWTMMNEGTQFTSLLQLLTAEFGRDLATFPSFAIVMREGNSGRVAVRGGFTAKVRVGEDLVSLDGGSLVTWEERQVAKLDAWTIWAPGVEEAGLFALGTGLVRDGVVPISRLSAGVLQLPDREVSEPASPQVEEAASVQEPPPAEEAPVVREEPAQQPRIIPYVPGPTPGAPFVPAPSPSSSFAPGPRPAVWADPAPQASPDYEEQSGRYSHRESPASESEHYHDGHTINYPQQREPVAEPEISFQDSVESPSTRLPEVLSVPCVDGHHNPPYLQRCRVCGKGMSRTLARIERPSLGRLVLSNGEVVELDRDLVFGRKPRDPHRAGRPNVRLITIDDEGNDVSRNHCEIRIEGWDARIRDLGSQNGTFLTHEGQETERVGEASPVILRGGDVIKLGSTVSMRVEC